MSRPTAEGKDKHGLVEDPPPWFCRLILRYLSSSCLKARLRRVEDARSTPTRRIRPRPSVLDRQPVLLPGVEASNRSRVRASSSDPALPPLPEARARYRERAVFIFVSSDRD